MTWCTLHRLLIAVIGWLSLSFTLQAQNQASPPAERVLLRTQFTEQTALKYRWQLSARSAWQPMVDGTTWLRTQTDFTFTMQMRALREDGSATLGILGQSLISEGESDKGMIGIQADRNRARWKVRGAWAVWNDNTPLKHDMSITLGPRWQVVKATGLEHLAVYFMPQVDRSFWDRLTMMPEPAVAPGDQLHDQLANLEVPGGGPGNQPLQMTLQWQVQKPLKYKGVMVLPIRQSAQMLLEDSPLTLDNGITVDIKRGSYEIRGVAYWQTDQGILMYAKAEQALDARTTDHKRYQNLASSELELLSAREE